MCYCGKKVKARGLCSAHYEAWRKANPFEVSNQMGKWSGAVCQHRECESPVRAQGLCQHHYNQVYYGWKRQSS